MSKPTEKPEAQNGPQTGRLPTGQFAPDNRLSVDHKGGSGGTTICIVTGGSIDAVKFAAILS